VKVIILAEVLSTRLKPYTTFLSKPILPVEEKPILECLTLLQELLLSQILLDVPAIYVQG